MSTELTSHLVFIGIKRERFSDSDDDTETVAKISKTEMSPKGQNHCKSATIM